ncbi:SDR family oxidoreductase [Pseudomaricurvus alkylphenolicus]|uniref:SDR family NAD(P)-dependent oxidoreductase n=1 Tax=Pseudomaricurvus alkylphenolicus TaxID=1306991 RepID=UPI001424981F|nr:SDR family oxidoreductase [Pseudomaricurvus alkylphenolicus]NIB44926.1 SDR family oxidoreductase [Pseudomaricurvus alkylphenolicus]
MDPLLDFTGKVILITGAASGFGQLLATEFSKRGAKLVIGDINEAGVQQVASTLDNDATAMHCDVSREDHCKAMVEAAIELYGRLDIAINNAGISHAFTPVHQITEELLDQQMDVNLKGVLFGMKHQIEAMKAQDGGGLILNVSSMAGLGGAPKIGAYAAAKHAVVGVTKTAAAEYGSKNIRVNAICPFYSLTPMVTDSEMSGDNPEQFAQFLAQGSPMKRLGQPEEITNVMLLLCSPGNTYMNGQTIAIDGGVSAL